MNEKIKEIANSCTKSVGEPIARDIYMSYIKPKVDKMVNRPKNTEIIYDIIEKYLNCSYEKNKYINTIVFNKETKTIDELYIPLSLLKNGAKGKEKIIINDKVENIFKTMHRIMIVDTAGMGKSTLIKFLYLQCISKKYGVPFLIELRKLDNTHGIFEYVCDELCLKGELNEKDVEFIVEGGDFIFFPGWL